MWNRRHLNNTRPGADRTSSSTRRFNVPPPIPTTTILAPTLVKRAGGWAIGLDMATGRDTGAIGAPPNRLEKVDEPQPGTAAAGRGDRRDWKRQQRLDAAAMNIFGRRTIAERNVWGQAGSRCLGDQPMDRLAKSPRWAPPNRGIKSKQDSAGFRNTAINTRPQSVPVKCWLNSLEHSSTLSKWINVEKTACFIAALHYRLNGTITIATNANHPPGCNVDFRRGEHWL